MYGENIMVISPLLKWYVEHGLKVTQIHQVEEYTPAACFQKFGDNISDVRRAGDADPEKKIVAETHKFDGNSSYGKTVTNKRDTQTSFTVKSIKSAAISLTLPSVAVASVGVLLRFHGRVCGSSGLPVLRLGHR